MFTLSMGRILEYARPGEKWSIHGNSRNYANLEWLDATSKPTEAELQTAELASAKAHRKRRVKREGRNRILTSQPDWKQRNAPNSLFFVARRR